MPKNRPKHGKHDFKRLANTLSSSQKKFQENFENFEKIQNSPKTPGSPPKTVNKTGASTRDSGKFSTFFFFEKFS